MANKLPMLEEFEQSKKDPCQCGGNCGCGGNKSVNEAAITYGIEYKSSKNDRKFKKASLTKTTHNPNIDKMMIKAISKDAKSLAKQDGWVDYRITKDDVPVKESVNEAKKYKFKDLAKAWEFVYGEDMEDEYEGFYQEVTGKYKNKVTKKDIAEIWQKVYGEDIEAEYDGFYNEIKESLDEANKLDEFNNLNEAKPDGTISDDEDERMDIAEQEFYDKALALAQELKEEAYEIGGDFRGPGYEHKLMLQVKDAFKKAKLKLR